MIERKNIIKLLGDRINVYHSALLTTYSFDPIYFESIYLSTLRKLGITNVVVLMDANMYDRLLSDTNYQYHIISHNNYTLVRQENYHSGVFHPKMVLLFGEEEGALIVGSGNLTYSGLANNDEVWNVFHILGNESVHYPLFYKAWRYLIKITNNTTPLVLKQIEWMSDNSPWLQRVSSEESVFLASGEECKFLFNSSESRIFDLIVTSIKDRKIDNIMVISPFYDSEGILLTQLKKHFSPKSMQCVIDIDRQSAPYTLLFGKSTIKFYKATSSCPLHAKIIELQGDETWLLCGSANAGSVAFGTNPTIYNDEACIFLHSTAKRNYIMDLGIQFSDLTSAEKGSIIIPKKNKRSESPLLVNLNYCEEKDNKLYLRFNKVGINGLFAVLDINQDVVFSSTITTDNNNIVDIKSEDANRFHIAVIRDGDTEISNRVLVIKETNIERGNPDPKRRKLSSLLDDADLLKNLSHILGYIEFEETDKQIISNKILKASAKKNELNDVVVSRERFNNLKDSKLSISMHPGVRILEYLQHILFMTDDNEQSDDELLDFDEKSPAENDNHDKDYIYHTKSDIDDASKMKSEVVYFLKKMLDFLINKTKDKDIYGDKNPAVNKPRLMAVPGLNAASSLAVASRAIVCMMNKYGAYIPKSNDVRDLFMKCGGVFLSVYANCFPTDDSLRSQKIHFILKEAFVDMLSALSFFDYGKDDSIFTQLILNSFDACGSRQEVNEIVSLYDEQLIKLNADNLNSKTIERIGYVAAVYLKDETPIAELSISMDKIYLYRKGHGFLIVDNIKHTGKGFSYNYHSPWFDDKVDNITSSKFRGYSKL